MIRNRSDNIGNDKEEQSDRYQTFEIEENDHDRNMQSEGTKTLSTVAFLTYKKMLISLVILVAVSQVILVLHIFMNKTMSIRTYENPIHYYSDETEHQNGRNHDGNQYYRTNYNNYNGQYYNYNRDNAGESGSYSKNSGYFSWGNRNNILRMEMGAVSIAMACEVMRGETTELLTPSEATRRQN